MLVRFLAPGRRGRAALWLASACFLVACGSSEEAKQAESPSASAANASETAGAPCDRSLEAPVELPTARGRLTTTEIDHVVREKLPAIEDCYVGLVKRTGQSGGTLRLHFSIAESGQTRSARVRSPDIKDGPFLCCVEKAVWDMRFPAPKGGDAAFVHEMELVQ